MKRKPLKKLNISGLLAVLVVLVVLIGGSYAAFTNQGFRKGVATTRKALTMFSSSHLDNYDTINDLTNYTFSYTEMDNFTGTVEAIFYVYNHDKDNPTQANPNDVTYTLEVLIEPLKDGGGLGSDYSINLNDGGNQSCTVGEKKIITSTIEGEKLNRDEWKINIPYVDLGKNKITITAVPNAGSVANNQKIGRIFRTSIQAKEQDKSFSWDASGILLDKTSTQEDSKKYSAFNFEITGIGKGTGTLEWDPSYVELDKHFIDNNNLTVTNGTGSNKKIELNLNSEEKSYYLLQFYRTAIINESETWDIISKKVKNVSGGYVTSGYIQFTAVEEE